MLRNSLSLLKKVKVLQSINNKTKIRKKNKKFLSKKFKMYSHLEMPRSSNLLKTLQMKRKNRKKRSQQP